MKCSITTVTGQVNLAKSSAKACIFHCPRSGGLGNAEVFIDKSTTGPTAEIVKRVGYPSFQASVPNCNPDIVGKKVTQAFSVEEGEILKVFISRRRGYGKRPLQGCVYLRARSAAAHVKLRFLLVEHASVSFTHAEVEGTFDILELDDVDAAGVKVLAGFRQYCDAATRAEILTDTIVVQPEIQPAVKLQKEVITNSDGEAKEVFKVKRKRALDL